MNTLNKRRQRRARRIRGLRRRRIVRAIARQRRQRMPIATPTNFRRTMQNTTVGATSARVSGKDLVYTIPTTISNAESSVIAVIPSNPAYWLGTKIATIARGYQNYRPMKFNAHYVPQCAATQAGNVIAGTMYHEAPNSNNLQQSLKTSNGGMITQVFKPATSKVRVGTNLQKNLYRVGGDIDDDSMPFYFIAIAIACKDGNNNPVVPGYFYIEYTYQFKNPIGGATEFANSGLTTFDAALPNVKKGNITAILCQSIASQPVTLGIGTQLDIEYDYDNNSWTFYYNGSQIQTPNVPIWIFSNQQASAESLAQMTSLTRIPIIYNKEVNKPNPATIPMYPYSAIIEKIGEVINTYTTQTLDKELDTEAQADYYITYDNTQSFGEFRYNYDDIIAFTASAARYLLTLSNSTYKPPLLSLSDNLKNKTRTRHSPIEAEMNYNIEKKLNLDPKVTHLDSDLDDEPK